MPQIIEVILDESGRIIVPKSLQIRLGLTPGMTLVVEGENQDEVALRPQTESPEVVDKDGVLVVRGEALSDLSSAVEDERERRLAMLLHRTGS